MLNSLKSNGPIFALREYLSLATLFVFIQVLLYGHLVWGENICSALFEQKNNRVSIRNTKIFVPEFQFYPAHSDPHVPENWEAVEDILTISKATLAKVDAMAIDASLKNKIHEIAQENIFDLAQQVIDSNYLQSKMIELATAVELFFEIRERVDPNPIEIKNQKNPSRLKSVDEIANHFNRGKDRNLRFGPLTDGDIRGFHLNPIYTPRLIFTFKKLMYGHFLLSRSSGAAYFQLTETPMQIHGSSKYAQLSVTEHDAFHLNHQMTADTEQVAPELIQRRGVGFMRYTDSTYVTESLSSSEREALFNLLVEIKEQEYHITKKLIDDINAIKNIKLRLGVKYLLFFFTREIINFKEADNGIVARSILPTLRIIAENESANTFHGYRFVSRSDLDFKPSTHQIVAEDSREMDFEGANIWILNWITTNLKDGNKP